MNSFKLRTKVKAFSLIELMLIVSLIAIIVTIAIPSTRFLVANGKKNAEVKNMMTTLAFARDSALNRKREVIVCSGLEISSSDDRIITPCVKSNIWQKMLVVYYDLLDPNDKPKKDEERKRKSLPPTYQQILHKHNLTKNFYWVWSAFGEYTLSYNTDGLTQQNGTFYLCSNKKVLHKVVLNKNAARMYDKRANPATDNKYCTF